METIMLNALLSGTVECPLLSERGVQELGRAEVILAVDTMTGNRRLMYGKEVLTEIVETGVTQSLPTLYVEIDEPTDDLEKLAAAILAVKGKCDCE
ncbi:MAG TPA: hypothetical protein VG826_29505 [Pirellulales bacterium]|nr:hypothetical protein [Pirellulales bacterium]